MEEKLKEKFESALQKSLREYESLKKKYDELSSTDEFDYINSMLPFQFLKARYLIEVLTMHEEGVLNMPFTTAEEAISLYHSLINFRKEKDTLLWYASYMDELIDVKDNINKLVADNPYLSSNMSLPSFGRIESIVKDCLKELPNYNKKMTKEFRRHFIESAIASLTDEELIQLINQNVIKPKDLDSINLVGSDKYIANIEYLQKVTGHNEICVKTINTRLRGTTFNNEDGSSRTEYLKQMAEAISKGGEINLIAENYEFTKDGGNPEPAIRVTWDGKCLGHIARDVVANIIDEFDSPYYKVDFKNITGGTNKLNFGCEIALSVYSAKPLKVKEDDKVLDKE